MVKYGRTKKSYTVKTVLFYWLQNRNLKPLLKVTNGILTQP